MRRLPPPGDHDAGVVWRHARACFHCCGQVHRKCHRAQDALGMVHQAHELAQVGFFTKIDCATQRRVVVVRFSPLDKQDLTAEMFHHGLITLGGPPFNREIRFAARDYNPEWCGFYGQLFDLGKPAFFLIGNVDVAAEFAWFDGDSEPIGEKAVKSVDKMIGPGVDVVN